VHLSPDRLVESPRIKRALEAVYSGVLPKGASPFIYLRFVNFTQQAFSFNLSPFSLQIDPRSVDVNVHPTKREVHFLNEEAIVERISDALQEALVVQSHSRVFEYQVCGCFQ
jgi:DNA mismatch repair protein MLH1